MPTIDFMCLPLVDWPPTSGPDVGSAKVNRFAYEISLCFFVFVCSVPYLARPQQLCATSRVKTAPVASLRAGARAEEDSTASGASWTWTSAMRRRTRPTCATRTPSAATCPAFTCARAGRASVPPSRTRTTAPSVSVISLACPRYSL